MYLMYLSVQAVVTNTIDPVLGGLNVRPLFLTVPESRKSQIKAPADSVSGESHLLTESSHGRRSKGTCWCLFYKGTNPIRESYTLLIS